MVLGSSEVNLLELVNSYCTVANDGRYNIPLLVERIEDRDGNLIYQAHKKEKKAIPYRSAYLMQRMLVGGLSGTSGGLWHYIRPFYADTEFGGKTGTSNNHADAWFVGVTPGLVGGAWVGGEYRQIHFRWGALGQGSRTALPICGMMMSLPLSIPAGILIFRVWLFLTVPVPRQAGHGSEMTKPRPPQVGQVRDMEKKPLDWRIWPAPPQVGQVLLDALPLAEPVPWQASHATWCE